MAPKTPKPKKVTKGALAAAQDTARAGRVDDAMPVLEAAAEQGSALAAYSLAEIHAFRGEWDRVLERLAQFMPGEADVYAGNVKRDAAGLLWRAAQETERWPEASKLLAKLDEQAVGSVFYKSLAKLMKAGGKGAAPKLEGSVESAAQRKKKLDEAKAKKDPFLIVMRAMEDRAFDADVVKHWDAALPELRIEYVLQGIPALVRAKKFDAAMRGLAQTLPDWMNVEDCQIAPVELLWDPGMRALMTPARCAAVLTRDFD